MTRHKDKNCEAGSSSEQLLSHNCHAPNSGKMTRVKPVMQELAVNRVLTQEEWNNLPSGLLDQVL